MTKENECIAKNRIVLEAITEVNFILLFFKGSLSISDQVNSWTHWSVYYIKVR